MIYDLSRDNDIRCKYCGEALKITQEDITWVMEVDTNCECHDGSLNQVDKLEDEIDNLNATIQSQEDSVYEAEAELENVRDELRDERRENLGLKEEIQRLKSNVIDKE